MSDALPLPPPGPTPAPRRARRPAGPAPWPETLLVLGLVAITGNPVLSNPAIAPLGYAVLLIGGSLLSRGRTSPRFLQHYAWLAAGFATVFAAHAATLGQVSWPGAAHFLVKIFVGGWLIDRLGPRFVPSLFRATLLLCGSSLVFYGVLLLTGPEAFPNWFDESLTGVEKIKSIGLFTVHMTPEWWRNSSMMWEPGAFQGLINLALFLMPTDALWQRRHRWRAALVVFTLVTTFSTTGYLVFFLVAVYKLGSARLSGLAKSVGLGLFVAIGLYVFLEADFLAQKIVEQYLDSLTYDGFMPDRFGAFLFDLQYIEKNPLFGNGLIEATRFADHPQLHGVALGHGNGLSNFIATFGFFGLAVYGLGILRCGFTLGPRGLLSRAVLLLLVATLSIGEQFLNTPLFLGLPFLMLAAVRAPRRPARRRARARRAQPVAPLARPEPA